ncbi:hypothetical protein Q6350_03670 [Isoptericola sp. b515]|uniref:hypothetical protein n=1 Tax=Isoptericola sp. b515 TaxID=3064652 RepID=UPI0027132F35|nr:hypothetical protein [Isoptericola sp. b515]MDO8147522.1 hypothetical protein [Isoptericola sp. b515]
MTGRPGRARGLAGLVAAVIALSVVGTVPAGAADLSDRGADAFAELAACVARTDTLVASVVVDESASLRTTDPEDQRVGAVLVAVDTLETLEAAGAEVVTELAVFGTEYTQVVGWGSPSGAHGAEMRDTISTQLPDRKQAQNTDYRKALRDAQRSVDAQRARLDTDSCSAILWFTDGKLDVGPDGADPTDEEALAELCAPDGLVDDVRAARTTVIALALFAQGDETVTRKDRLQLKAVAEGAGGKVECGTSPVPEGATGGAYLRADQPSALRRLFGGAGALMEGYTPAGDGSLECPRDCPVTIHADAAVGSFRVVHELDEGASAARLTSPAGDTHQVAPGTVEAGGSTITTHENDRLFVTDVTPGPDGVGDWLLDAEGATLVDLYYRWGADLDIASASGEGGLVLGQENTVVITPRSADGSVAGPELFSEPLDLSVQVDGSAAEVTARRDGTYIVPVELDTRRAASEVDVSVTAGASSSPHDVDLGPIVVGTRLPTRLPPSYPTITPTRLDVGSMTVDAPGEAALQVEGPSDGESEVCIEPFTVQGPKDAGEITLTVDEAVAPGGCVALDPGATASVPVTLTAQNGADGALSGDLTVVVSGAHTDETITLDVPVEGSIFRPVDEGTRWGLTAGLLALAGLLAWLVAFAGRHLTDRYPLGQDLRRARVPVTVTAGGVRRRDGGQLLTPDDFYPVAQGARKSRFEVPGLTFDRRGPWWWPWKAYRGRVRARGDGIVLTGMDVPSHTLDSTASSAPVEFPGTRHVYLVPDLASGTGGGAETASLDADLVLLAETPGGSTRAVIESWETELAGYTEWPELIAEAGRARTARAAEQAERPTSSRRPRAKDRAEDATAPQGGETAAAPDPSSSDGPPSVFGEESGPASPRRGRPGREPADGPGTSPPSSSAPDDDQPPRIDW